MQAPPSKQSPQKLDPWCGVAFFLGLASGSLVPMGFAALAILAGIIGLRRPKPAGDRYSNGFAWAGIVWATIILLLLSWLVLNRVKGS